MSDLDQVNNTLQGMLASIPNVSDIKTQLRQTLRRSAETAWFTDGGTAGSAIGEQAFFSALVPCQVLAVYFQPGIAITANGTNLATITVQKRPASAPGTPVTVAQNSTNTTDPVLGANAVAFTRYAMTLSATVANLQLVGGDLLTFGATKSGTGVALGAAATAAGANFLVEVQIEEL